MSKSITGNSREIIAAQGLTGQPEYLTSTNGALNVNGSFSITGGATSANQTNGTQKTQIVDGSGNVISSTSNSLNVNVTNAASGGTAATDNSAFTAGTTQGTPSMGFYHSTIDAVTDGRAATVAITSKRAMMVNLQTAAGAETGIAGLPLQVSLANTAANATAVKVDGSAVTQPVSLTSTTITGTVAATQSGTWNVTNISGTVSLPTGAATSAKQPALGTAGSASTDVITVQGVASMTALKVDGSGVTQPVSGTVSITANSAVNVAQVNGVTTLMGNGVTGTGSQRVTLASDNSAVSGMGVGVIGSAVPANANYLGVSDGTNLRGILQAANALNTTGTGIPSAQVVAQFDDASPTAITENQFGNLRMSANRNLYGTIRDAAGNERGVNVTAGNALTVDGSASTQPVSYATTGSGTATGALRVELANNGTGLLSTVTSLTQMNGQAIAMGTGARSAGTQRVTIATDDVVPASQSGTWTVQPGNTANSTPWLVTDTPSTTGGLSVVTGSVGATATVIKASAGQLYGYHLFNTTAAVAYVQIFNTAAASVTLGTTVPVISIGIPASGGVTVNFDKGLAFSTAISFGCTTTRAGLTGATCDVNFFYK